MDDDEVELFRLPGRRLALIIGVERYQDQALRDLSAPIADGRAIASCLEADFGFQFAIRTPDDDPLCLRLENPTFDQIDDVLADLEELLREDDRLLIWFAGHSLVPPELDVAYWAPADATVRRLRRCTRETSFATD